MNLSKKQSSIYVTGTPTKNTSTMTTPTTTASTADTPTTDLLITN